MKAWWTILKEKIDESRKLYAWRKYLQDVKENRPQNYERALAEFNKLFPDEKPEE